MGSLTSGRIFSVLLIPTNSVVSSLSIGAPSRGQIQGLGATEGSGDTGSPTVNLQPTDSDRQALFRARDAFNIKNNAALWLLIAILGHYETLYGKFPALIAEAAASVTGNVRAAAETELRAASARARSELAQSVAKAARDIADRAATTKRSQWIATSLILTASMFIVVGGWTWGKPRP